MNSTTSTGPYAAAAYEYLQAGWDAPIPVDVGGEGKVLEGTTGYNAMALDAAKIAEFVRSYGNNKIGLRMPDGILGIDVDAYGDKGGGETLEFWEQQIGEPLPDTWVSTSRYPEDMTSGIRFFRVPADQTWRSDLGRNSGVEIIRPGHRWARVWPSIAPRTGRIYSWYEPGWSPAVRLPRPTELAELSSPWIRELRKDAGTRASTATSHHDGTDEYYDWSAYVNGTGIGSQEDQLTRAVASMWTAGVPERIAIPILVKMVMEFENDPNSAKGRWTPEHALKKWRECRLPRGGLTDVERAWVEGVVAAAGVTEVTDKLAEVVLREKLLRTARRALDEEEFAAARGPRTKRTANEYADVPQPAPVIEKVLAAEVNLLGGPSAAGKSLLGRDWALHVAAGEAWRGFRTVEPRNVLWVASEGLHDFADRWTSQPLWDRAKDRVYVLEEPVNLLSDQDVTSLLDEYAEERPGLIVFDLVYGMGMRDDNGTKDVVPVINAMKKISAALGCATLAMGHNGLNGERRFRGSSAWRQQAAVEWHMNDSRLTCEKSKIANHRELTKTYDLEYPSLRWTTPMQLLATTADRLDIIREDIERRPDDSQRARAERLSPRLGLAEPTVRRLIRTVQNED